MEVNGTSSSLPVWFGISNRMRNQLSKYAVLTSVPASAAFLEHLHLPWVKHLPEGQTNPGFGSSLFPPVTLQVPGTVSTADIWK